MKIYTLILISLLCPVISGCGQTGPLYLPTQKPPIHVEPEPEQKSETEKNK